MAMFNKGGTKICRACGNPFVPQNDEDFCFKCRNSESAKKAEITDYLREHPGTSIMEFSRQTSFSTGILINMAHEGHFEGYSLGKDSGKPCAMCGKLISVGTYCPTCFEALKKDSKNLSNLAVAKAKLSSKSKDDAMFGAFDKVKGSTPRTFSTSMQNEINSYRKKR